MEMYDKERFGIDSIEKNFYKYELYVENGQYKVKERELGIGVLDPNIIDQAIFANLWIHATMYNRPRKELDESRIDKDDLTYAFGEEAKATYNKIMDSVCNQLMVTGDIEPTSVMEDVRISKSNSYKYDEDIIKGLFQNRKTTDAFVEWDNKATPFRRDPSKQVPTYEEAINREKYGKKFY